MRSVIGEIQVTAHKLEAILAFTLADARNSKRTLGRTDPVIMLIPELLRLLIPSQPAVVPRCAGHRSQVAQHRTWPGQSRVKDQAVLGEPPQSLHVLRRGGRVPQRSSPRRHERETVP